MKEKNYATYKEALKAAKEFNREHQNTIVIYRPIRIAYSHPTKKFVKVIDKRFNTVMEYYYACDSIINIKCRDTTLVLTDSWNIEHSYKIPDTTEETIYNIIDKLDIHKSEKNKVLEEVKALLKISKIKIIEQVETKF